MSIGTVRRVRRGARVAHADDAAERSEGRVEARSTVAPFALRVSAWLARAKDARNHDNKTALYPLATRRRLLQAPAAVRFEWLPNEPLRHAFSRRTSGTLARVIFVDSEVMLEAALRAVRSRGRCTSRECCSRATTDLAVSPIASRPCATAQRGEPLASLARHPAARTATDRGARVELDEKRRQVLKLQHEARTPLTEAAHRELRVSSRRVEELDDLRERHGDGALRSAIEHAVRRRTLSLASLRRTLSHHQLRARRASDRNSGHVPLPLDRGVEAPHDQRRQNGFDVLFKTVAKLIDREASPRPSSIASIAPIASSSDRYASAGHPPRSRSTWMPRHDDEQGREERLP